MEMRYNLATKVMRNGVEVIVATDRNARPVEEEYLRLLSSTVTRPITLAPHTLTNLMSMVLPSDHVTDDQNHLIPFLQPTFATRTFYTTYHYLSTVLKNNTTAVSKAKTTVTNFRIEPYSKVKISENSIQPTATLSLDTSPTLQTEVFPTAYTYFNTFLDGDQPFVMTATQTVTNTFIGISESLNELEPSEVFPTTNTYLKTLEFTKTLTDGTDSQIVSTKDVVTQVIVTDRPGKKISNMPITTDVTKTYFVTYTYFSTYVEGDKTKVKSDVSVSSDVTIEKFYIKPKKTETKVAESIKKTESPQKEISTTVYPFSVLATKTYLTTFTYFTTLLKGPNSEKAETKINSRTKVVENVITETIPLQDLNTEYLMQLNNSIYRLSGALVATATLKNGNTILVTAQRNPAIFNSYQKYEIKPTKTVSGQTKTGLHQLLMEEAEPVKQSFTKTTFHQVKTKTTLSHKQKVKSTKTVIQEATAQPLIATKGENENNEITPTVTMTPASLYNMKRTDSITFDNTKFVAPTKTSSTQESSTTYNSKVNVIKDKTEDSIAVESNSVQKNQTLKQPNNQMNVSALLNLPTLGINGMNVLGPVFNAMAELIHNNLNTKIDTMSRRNDSVESIKETDLKKPSSNNINPLFSFVNKFTPAAVKGGSEPKVKQTTARTPVYIPVGSFAQDSEFGESQDSHLVIENRPDWHEKWKDTHAKNFEKGRPHDTPITILEGGIPISPGQVITTNSDVIIGRPGESGPRPPTFAVKNNVPVDMKPPPLPQVLEENVDILLGQHSTNQGVDFDQIKDDFNVIPPRPHRPPRPPLPPTRLPPKKHIHEGHTHKIVRPPPGDRLKGNNHRKPPHFSKHTHTEYDSGATDLNPPPVPPPPIRSHDVHKPITINHEQEDSKTSQTSAILPIPVHLGPNQNVENYINPAELNPTIVAIPTVPIVDQLHQENVPIISEPTPGIDLVSPNNILLVPNVAHVPVNIVATGNPVVDRSTGQQLLVNIQPSQVANIVIPHGSSTALILSGGNQHSLKGEVIDDPSPHPEPETVGFVGAEPVLKIENEDIHTSLRNEIISGTRNSEKQNFQDHGLLFSNRPQLTTELIKIRPKPTSNAGRAPDQHSAFNQHSQNIYLSQNKFGNQSPQQGSAVYQQSGSSLAENHRHTDTKLQSEGGVINLHHYIKHEGQNSIKDSGGAYFNIPPQDSVKGATNEVSVNQNYRKENPSLSIGADANYFHDIPLSVSQNVPIDVFLTQNQNQGNNYLINTGGLFVDQTKFIEGQNLVKGIKGENGIYVDISPPGHLPPRPNTDQLQNGHLGTKHQSAFAENLSNHQSGVVHDVPLNAQVQLGSAQKQENLLKDILIGENTNNHDNVINTKDQISDLKFLENQKKVKLPSTDLSGILSPPPLPDTSHRPHRPLLPPQHPTVPAQKYPSVHPHPQMTLHSHSQSSGHSHSQVSLYPHPQAPVHPHPQASVHPHSQVPVHSHPQASSHLHLQVPQHLHPQSPLHSHPQTLGQNHPQPSNHNIIPKPADFMIPPPHSPQRPTNKPHSDLHSRPLIPIGAGAPQQNYPNPRPEDILIIPHKNPPGVPINNAANINVEIQKQPNIYSDVDVTGGRDPLKTEYGEEIQESISRPLFPGQLPSELQKFNLTKGTNFDNHKNVDLLKVKPLVNKIKEQSTTTESLEQSKLDVNFWESKNTAVNPSQSKNTTKGWSSNHQLIQGIKGGENRGTALFGNNSQSSFYSHVKRPSGFVSPNKPETTSLISNHKPSFGNVNLKERPSFPNHKETPGRVNHKESSESVGQNQENFESYKVSSGIRGGIKTSNKNRGTVKYPSGFVHTNHNNNVNNKNNEPNKKIKVQAGIRPSILASGFVKNEYNENTNKDLDIDHTSELHTEESNQGTTVFVNSDNNKVQNNYEQESDLFTTTTTTATTTTTTASSTTYKPPNEEVFTNTGNKKIKDDENDREKVKNKIKDQNLDLHSEKHKNNFGSSNRNKSSDEIYYGITENILKLTTSSENYPQKLNSFGGIKNRPANPPQTSNASGTTNFSLHNISKNSSANTVGSHFKEQNLPNRHITSSGPQGYKRPTTTYKKDESLKLSGGLSVGENIQYNTTDKKESTQKYQGANNEGNYAAGSIKDLSGFINKNETSITYGTNANHKYRNQTINYFVPKPTYDVNEERDVTYNIQQSNVDNWFATTFGGNADKNNYPSKKNNPALQRNTTGAIGTDVQIALLTPPKVTEVKTKPEEVMGLSPPPLERPRRPQRPQRPKPPYKFEVPTTPKSTHPPIAIENDFPPVRSPEFNRKPIKPQDIFPPRLPDNFVHHLPDYPIRNVPKPRPQDRPITSMPIDIPHSSTTEKISNFYSSDLEENDGRDPYFAGSEINGHSKPIFDDEPLLTSMRPPPPPAPVAHKPKPGVHSKPPSTNQPPSKVKPKPDTTLIQDKLHETTTTEYKHISPTSTFDVATKTTYHTKVSASVTPTATYPYKDWENEDIITGSETVFDPDQFSSHVTPTISDVTSKKIVTTLISTGSTTIFGDLYTAGSEFAGTGISETTAAVKVQNNNVKSSKEGSIKLDKPSIAPTKTVVPVHTTTLTVTTTMTTVVHSIGHKPFTKTIVLTKTLISTVFNKITETKTLVKPTTATIIQTHTVATTKTALVVPTALYPSQTKYPTGGTMKPEIFVADPHAKDTMTISVSSSMNKNNKNGDEKRKPGGNDSIMFVVSNKHPDENDNLDVDSDDENEINDSRVMVGGVYDANDEKDYKDVNKEVECSPTCKPKRNELCQRIEGVMKCVCRPGFARMFPDRPCRPTYTYNMKLMLEKLGSEQINYEKSFTQSATPNMAKLASATKEGLDRMIMQSDLRDVYHGVMVNGFEGKERKTMVDFYVQLSENTDEHKLMDIFKKTLQTSNYSLGGTELFAAREADNLNAEDFNECLNPKFHDCSENARCFNLKGTYTCSCKEGFTDLSENSLFPGRICSDMIGCEYCGYHGACYSKGEGQITCECFQWYSGERCHINLKVLLIALVTIGAILLALLLVCGILTCLNKRSRSSTASRTNGSSAGYLRYRGPSNHSLDRRAMIGDSSSESSVDNLPYICPPPLPSTNTMSGKKKPVMRHVKGPAPRPGPPPGMDQRDRSVTVMIPRAKYRPMPPLSPHLTMSTFSPDKHLHKTAAQIATEQKLISYLDGNTRTEERSLTTNTNTQSRQTKEQQKNYTDYKSSSTNLKDSPRPVEKKKEHKVFEYEYKMSNMLFTEETNSTDKRSAKSGDDRFRRHSDSTHLNSDNRNSQFRKYSAGALVSAGYEVSAKVGMHHLEDDTTEDDHSGIINSLTMKSSRSQFTTLNRTGDHKTMSEARSYDETTIQPPTRSLKTHYSGSSPSSRVNNDEGHTMIERDLGSTFIMPESQLFKPEADRGSDISNFDSL